VADDRAIDEVRDCFTAYEQALLANDVEAMDGWFARDAAVVRFGIAERQHGFDEISAWRRIADPVPADRRHVRTTFTPAGDDVVVVALEFANGDALGVGRQSQVWARTAAGWRIVHAHVSMEASGPS
jgi:ketosteroid isomerase-like protein